MSPLSENIISDSEFPYFFTSRGQIYFFQLISYCIQPFPCMQARSLRPAESLNVLRQSCLHLSAWGTTPHTYIHYFKSLFKISWCGGIYITHIYSGVIISAEHL